MKIFYTTCVLRGIYQKWLWTGYFRYTQTKLLQSELPGICFEVNENKEGKLKNTCRLQKHTHKWRIKRARRKL